ncbi:DUF4402 domain-containing protein [Sphingorhabdus arenilitoris]|uniref:DUF4402 domain-containing protein n=1 Tax=Sphingorhabdus arenilitoris TaxID=1490041 RepID=A0ABV8RHT0_9SPHN
MPAHADVESADGRAVIIRPLSFINYEDLNFGKIIPASTAGTVTVAPNGTRTTNNSNIVLVGTDHQAARFTGQGTFNQRVDISLASNTIVINGAGTPMTVSTFTIGSTPSVVLTTTPTRFRIASANGIFAFTVGARLNVAANQAPGKYSGTWNITLNYQ